MPDEINKVEFFSTRYHPEDAFELGRTPRIFLGAISKWHIASIS